MSRDRFVGVWLLDRSEGVLLLLPEGWCSMQTTDGIAWAGHYGIDGDKFLLTPVVAASADDIGRVIEWRWSFDGDVLVLVGAGADAAQRWQREGADVVTGLGSE